MAGRILVAIDGECERFEALLGAARGGDANARDQLFRLAQEHFHSWIKKHPAGSRFHLRHTDLDLFQETALRAIERLSTVAATSPAAFLSWFDEMLAHKLAELLRHDFATKKRDGAREVRLDLADRANIARAAAARDGADSCRAAEDDERVIAIRDALAGLSERQRRMIELRYFKDLPYQAVADELHETPEAVRSALRRILSRLRKRLLRDDV